MKKDTESGGDNPRPDRQPGQFGGVTDSGFLVDAGVVVADGFRAYVQ